MASVAPQRGRCVAWSFCEGAGFAPFPRSLCEPGGLAAFLVALAFALRLMPKRGWRAALRGLGLVFVGGAGFLLAYDILFFEPVSPLVLIGCGALVYGLVRLVLRKRHLHVGQSNR